MPDPFANIADTPMAAAKRWQSITPNDDADLPLIPKALWVNGGGNLELVGDDGVSLTFAVVAAMPIDLRPTRIKANGTTATGIRALY